jgi:hypothetical protein
MRNKTVILVETIVGSANPRASSVGKTGDYFSSLLRKMRRALFNWKYSRSIGLKAEH